MPNLVAMERVSLRTAIGSLATAKAAGNRRSTYISHLKMCLAAFVSHAGDVPIDNVTTDHLESFLATRGASPWTRITYTARLSTLFAFAMRRRWITENPCFFLERVTVDQKPPNILTPEEARKLVNACRSQDRRGLAWLALTLYAGLRPSEARMIQWDKIDFEAGRIWVDACVSKVRRMRIVEPRPSAMLLLAEARDTGAELPISLSTLRRIMRRLRSTMGWTDWPADVTRHTCASYWLAIEPDAGRIALQLGNSSNVLMRHYRSVVTKEQAAEFFRQTLAGCPTPQPNL